MTAINITVNGSAKPALPPGFQIESGPPGADTFLLNVPGGTAKPAAPKLPDGFQIETPPQPAPQSVGDQLSAGFTSGIQQLPFVGPSLLSALENYKADVQNSFFGAKDSPFFDKTYTPQTGADIAASDQRQANANPVASTVGSVAGNVLPFVAGGEIPAVAKVLGMDAAMPLLARTLFSGGSQAAITAGDELLRGADPRQAAMDALVSGGIGLVAPGAGDLIGHLMGVGAGKVAKAWDTLTNPERAAQKITSGAVAQDIKTGQPVMSAADEASAAANGQPVINADRYGNYTRNLARTAANADPAAEQALKGIVEDRFTTQNARAVDFLKSITGNVDDVALRDMIQSAASKSNDAAYRFAESQPAAKFVWSPELAQLFQSPSFRKAVQDATKTAAEDAAVGGRKGIQNPFQFDANGAPSWRQIARPDGTVGPIAPNLQFWDIVQRNLRQDAQQLASREGMKMSAGQTKAVRDKLLEILDAKVPAFKAARTGAAAAFGAEDALDAGRKFVGQKMAINEARKAIAKFTPAEKKAFATGFASELIDKINSVSDRVNVINQVFGSPAARAQVELALGKGGADRLEQFVRIEDIMQMTKQAVSGNSSTAKQLIASGLIGGGLGGAISGWDPREMASGAFLLAAGRAGMRAVGKAADQKVMQKVAEMLTSSDPRIITRATQMAAQSPAMKAALQAIERGMHALVKGETVGTLSAASSPSTAPAP